MSHFQRKLVEHPLWEELKKAKSLSSRENFLQDLSDEERWVLDRIHQSISLADRKLRSLPIQLLTRSSLSKINNEISPLRSFLEGYERNRSPEQLATANSKVDALLNNVSEVLSIGEPEEIEDLLRNYYQISDDLLLLLKQKSNDREEALIRQERELERVQSRFEELSGQLAEVKAEAKLAISAIEGEYANLAAKIASESQKTTEDSIEKNTAAAGNFESFARKILEKISAHEGRARDIVQLVGNIGTTGNYKNTAELETKQANFWRNVTVAFFVLALAAAFWAALTAHLDVTTFISRVLFAVLVGSVTLYTGRESARHRTNADSARRVELELASLGPFMEDLPKEQRDSLREKLTDRYFGKEVAPHSMEPVLPLEKIISLLIEKLAESKPGK